MLTAFSLFRGAHDRSEKLFVQMVQLGFVEALKGICTSQKIDKVSARWHA
jgi:hypothetical protein